MPDATRTPAPSAPRVTAEPGWGAPGEPRYRPIESYGLIGDMRTAALVGRDGAIDWFCPGRFDAPSLFAAILDADIGGSFRVAPAQPCSSKHLYLPETAILLTRFHSDGGVAEVTDFMPVGAEPCALVRRVDVVRGAVDFRMSCRPGFDYARRSHRVTLPGRRVARFTADDGSATELSSRLPLAIDGAAATARFQLQAGESAWFVLHPAGAADAWTDDSVGAALDATREFWRGWLSSSHYDGRWREMVQRSAITLKLCTYAPSGAMVASPTCSLPETIGGGRNWDYRYAWLRDSAFTAFAFQRLGFDAEARDFAHWLGERCRATGPGDPTLQIVYAIDGNRDLAEHDLSHLEGYRGSRPVRTGNDAHGQLQLDVYGEVMDAVYLANKTEPVSWDLWTISGGCSTGSPTTGSSPTRASGRSVAAVATSSTRG